MVFFVLAPNAHQVANAIRQVFKDIQLYPEARQSTLDHIASRNVLQNINAGQMKGSQGGVIGKDAVTGVNVTWDPGRSPLTINEHKATGGSGRILQHTGEMLGAVTTGASSSVSGAGFGAKRYTRTAGAFGQSKWVNHWGEANYPATFPTTRKAKTMDIPARPFMFWNTRAAESIRNDFLLQHWPRIVNRAEAMTR